MKAVRPIFLSLLLGGALKQADAYFGTGDGTLGLWVLGMVLAAGLLFDFQSSVRSLRQPRRLDVSFVGGMDYAGRKTAASAETRSACWRQLAVPALAGLTLAILAGRAPLFILIALGVYLVESLAITAALLAVIRFGLLPVSAEGFHGHGSRETQGLPAAPFFLRCTHAVARFCSIRIPGGHAWVLRRKLIHLLRADPVFLIIYVLVAAALGVQFLVFRSLIGTVTFTLTACMLSLTLIQLGSTECDDYYRKLAYLMPGERVKLRIDLLLYAAVAALFTAYFLAAMFLHKGAWPGFPWRLRAFWQSLLTLAAFPLLLMADAPGAVKTTDARVILNFAYLGLAASLFMFPILGPAVAAGVLCIAAVSCLGRTRLRG